MSSVAVRPLFARRLAALGFEQWKDAFNIENIPASRLSKAFHIETITGAGRKQNQSDQELNVDVTVRIWEKGFKNPSDALDRGFFNLDRICGDILSSSVRLVHPIKNITLGAVTLEPIDQSNDNTIVVTIGFTAFVILPTV